MSWLYESETIRSDKNGTIHCRRILGRWKITVGGYDETSTYVTKMWKQALERLPSPRTEPTRVLLLGLGAGGIIEPFHRRFPNCEVTVIEWDPQMVALADRLGIYDPSHRPNIILEDITIAIPTLNQPFDLIVVDVFRGPEPAPILHDRTFLTHMRRLLNPNGNLLVNVFRNTELFKDFDSVLARAQTWTYYTTYLAWYQPKSVDASPRT